jgi:hypothetical protein
MSTNRKAAEAIILEYIEKMLPGSENPALYKNVFKTMDDGQFSKFMADLEKGKTRLAIIAPNFNEKKLDVQRNLEIAKELGHNFFQKLWIEGTGTTPTYLTPIPYMVLDLPLRRQAQLLVKKISIPEDNKSVDDFTGQPTGKSKGSRMSYPETQIMAAMGLDQCLIEMLKFRGGDVDGFNAMNTSISRTGEVSLKSIASLASGVESTKTLKTILSGMHISSTI